MEENAYISGHRMGVVSSTLHSPTTTEHFAVNLDVDQETKRFDIITVPTPEQGGRTYGVITEIVNMTEAPNHLTNSMDTDISVLPGSTQTKLYQVTTATAAVLSHSAGRDMPVPHGADTYLATSAGIHEALGISWRMQYTPEKMIPIGFIRQSNGVITVIHIDREFLLGDEGAHLNASGTSGLATKTSFLTFTLQSVLQHELKYDMKETAAIILNSKKADLLRIHEPRKNFLPEDIANWQGLGLAAQPFRSVRYFLPRGMKGSPHSFQPIPEPHTIYAYTLLGAVNYLDLLFTQVPDESRTLTSTMQRIQEILWNRSDKERNSMDTWQKLVGYLPIAGKSDRGGNQRYWHHIRSDTLTMVTRHFEQVLSGPGKDLFVNAVANNEELVDNILDEFRPGDIYVFDIANLRERERGFVVGSLLRAIANIKTDEIRSKLFPSKVIIYLDELGKYAPRGARNALVDNLIDIAERGRSSGEILFGAEQSRNGVHERILGNVSNSVMGMTGSAELGGSSYQALSSQIKATIPRLVQGEMVFIHPVFRLPVKINFPKPAWE
jgi:uncharacterized protein